MKILSAHVRDPRKGGEYRNPFLTLEVDEDVHETGTTRSLGGTNADWLVTPHGPFVTVDYETVDNGGNKSVQSADIGMFNATGLFDKRLVEVVILTPDEEIDMSMDLIRARRLLRKHSLPWRFVLDDVAGQHGKLLWRLAEEVPHCVRCGARGTHEAYYSGTYLTLCTNHMAEHNRKVRHLRTTNS